MHAKSLVQLQLKLFTQKKSYYERAYKVPMGTKIFALLKQFYCFSIVLLINISEMIYQY